MFQRYTEKARRVIFFARYEASNYGSREIGSEHLLLGLLREDPTLAKWFLEERYLESEIRGEIESRIVRGERIATSVEMPLSTECKKALNLAGEEADRLAHQHIGTEHLWLGLLSVEGSMAAQILQGRGLRADVVREKLAKGSVAAAEVGVKAEESKEGLTTLESFLAGLKCENAEELVPYFAANALFLDVNGKRWNREEIGKHFETLFAPYAKKNAKYVIEEILACTSDLLVALVLWKNAILASEQRVWIHRMTFILTPQTEGWTIVFTQVTPVQFATGRIAPA